MGAEIVKNPDCLGHYFGVRAGVVWIVAVGRQEAWLQLQFVWVPHLLAFLTCDRFLFYVHLL